MIKKPLFKIPRSATRPVFLENAEKPDSKLRPVVATTVQYLNASLETPENTGRHPVKEIKST
jgi:hypothetical protein